MNNNGVNFEPQTGQPINQNNNGVNFDPQTGQPINQNNNGVNFGPQTGQPINQNVNSQQIINTFSDEHQKKQEKCCELGFWGSILGMFFLFLGSGYILIIYILIFYLAFQGLKTRKRKKAIAAIIINSISLLIIALLFLLTNFGL